STRKSYHVILRFGPRIRFAVPPVPEGQGMEEAPPNPQSGLSVTYLNEPLNVAASSRRRLFFQSGSHRVVSSTSCRPFNGCTGRLLNGTIRRNASTWACDTRTACFITIHCTPPVHAGVVHEPAYR